MSLRIGLLGCKGTTLDLLHGLRKRGKVAINTLITLPPGAASRAQVAFYAGGALAEYAGAHGLALHWVTGYAMTHAVDREMVAAMGLDMLLVIGWERLIPPAILQSLPHGALGMHGSAFGLPRGRGRSPLNWAILTHQTQFQTSLFRYDDGVDSGDVLGNRTFEITPFDDIETLHAKNRIAMMELVEAHLPQLAAGEADFMPQPNGQATYYPRRVAEDGGIDWSRPTREIHALIRAVAPPYPGAFCFLGDRRIGVEAAQPFDARLFAKGAAPGTVLDVSIARNRLVVATVDGSLLMTRFSGCGVHEISPGDRLKGVDASQIHARILSRYPADLPTEAREIG